MLPDYFKELKSYQKINHFPGTGGIGRKDRLCRNIGKARRLFGAQEYNFLPETYLLPQDRSLWEMKFGSEPPGTLWICKDRKKKGTEVRKMQLRENGRSACSFASGALVRLLSQRSLILHLAVAELNLFPN
jgi:hypothetical protein